MDNLTQEQIEELTIRASASDETLRPGWCKSFVHILVGYLRNPVMDGDTFESTRQYFFRFVQSELGRTEELTRQGNRSSKGTVWGGQLLGWTTQKEVDALEKSIKTDY